MVGTSFPLLSALVLTYNQQDYIASSIKGLLSVDYPNMEIFVLDDGSTDETFAIAQSFSNSSQCPVIVQTQEHSFGRSSENSQKLVGLARGKYLLFMAGDDTLAPGFAATSTIMEMDRDENITMAFARILHVRMGDSSQISTVYTPELQALLRSGNPEEIYYKHLCERVSRLFLQGAIVRRSFIDEFGGFDTALVADDYAFIVRAFQSMLGHKKKILFKEDDIVIYREHPGNVHKRVWRQWDVFAEVVAKYIPPEHWPTFRMDYGAPRDLADFQAIHEHMIRHFGRAMATRMFRKVTEDYVHDLFWKRDIASLREFLLAGQLPLATRLYPVSFALRNSLKIASRLITGELRSSNQGQPSQEAHRHPPPIR
jgi:glycosyltransferase involved in cell wall biosynthesis